ncbi:tyrosine-type recombinase/integrase [Micromonospora sp. A202]|uniref:tyrosine-type recombinase/integrase n=1 Tax=Micromonospora sp. A202 TaxID=2572899 RepID=UPI00351A0AF5
MLRKHLRRQRQQQAVREAAGRACYESGYVFISPRRQAAAPRIRHAALHPTRQASRHPPIRLHDLRHGTASLAHQAGADLRPVRDLLGHASIVTTAHTYTSVLPYAHCKCAEATARLVLAVARRTRERSKRGTRATAPTPKETSTPPTKQRLPPTKGQVNTYGTQDDYRK